jgi:TPR repeat protein
MSSYEDAQAAFEAGDMSRVQALLEPLAEKGDRAAQTALGTFLALRDTGMVEGVRWLRMAADAGDGHAAHNLATILLQGGLAVAADKDVARHYFQVAHDSGFEASISSDPLWWRRDRNPGDPG